VCVCKVLLYCFFFHAGCKQYIGILGASLPGTGHWHEINVTETNGYMRTINKSNDSWVGAMAGQSGVERERESKKKRRAQYSSAHTINVLSLFSL